MVNDIPQQYDIRLQDEYLAHYHVKKFSKGELILCEGEIPTTAYVIKKGVVKTYNITSEGQEKPISFELAYEPLPIGWLFYKFRRSTYYYEAYTDCELYAIPREELYEHIQADKELQSYAFNYFVKRYLNAQMRINALEQSKAADKVVHTLQYLCLRYGRDTREDVVKIMLPLTQQDLANFMGLTRETTGIELKKLERRGIISYNRQNYTVYTDKLNEILDEEFGSLRFVEHEEEHKPHSRRLIRERRFSL